MRARTKATAKSPEKPRAGSGLPQSRLRQLGDELLRLTEAFGWISRNGHDIMLCRGRSRDIFGVILPEDATMDTILAFFSRSGRAALRQAIIACLNRGEPWDIDLEVASGPGKGNWLRASGTAMDIDGVRHLTGVFRNVNKVRKIENRLARETREKTLANQMLAQLLDVLPNAIAAYDPQDRLVFYNKQYPLYYDKAAPAIRIGEKYDNILKCAVENAQYANVDPAKAKSREWMRSRLLRHKKGMKRDLVQQLSSGRWVQVRERKSSNGYTVFVSTDISGLKKAEERIRLQAEHDSLTGLLNRSSFMKEFGDFLKHRRRRGTDSGCVILLDLDHFKSINDTLGHHMGDALLSAMAARIKDATRATDLAARLGGDEFAIFLPDVTADNYEIVAEKIHAALTKKLPLGSETLHPGVSMGVALVTSADKEPDTLIRKADTALFKAKKAGRNGWRNFDKALQQRRERRRYIINGLREAIARQDFDIYLQPQISFTDRAHAGFEVLARWTHEGKPVSPAEFIPISETNGMILDIGRIILAKSFSWFATMKQRGTHPGRIAVNISPVQMKCAKFIGSLHGALEMYGLEPSEVEIEVTETAIIGRDEDIIERRLKELADMGLEIALDDFGTGNATFSHLKRFPIKRLKIDKLFVDDIGKNAENTIITQAIINLAHNLGMEVIAEGIETSAQNSFLHINGCDIAQGYFHSRPLPLPEAEKWLKRYHPAPPRRPVSAVI